MGNASERLYQIICLLGGLAGAIIALSMALGALEGEQSSILFSTAILLIIWVSATAAVLKWPLFQNPRHTLALMLLLFMALCLRLSLFDHQSGDYVSFLSKWTDTMRGMTVREALSTPIGDYNMPYLYVILIISRLPFYDLYCIKLFSVAADVAVALAVGYLVKLGTGRQRVVLLCVAAALLCPTTWLGSSYWGQCDSVYGAFALWGLYFGIRKKPIRSLLLFSFSLAFKLQAVFILPILAFLLVGGYLPLKRIWVFPAGFLACMVPALLGGRSFSDTFSIYADQTNAYPYLSLNAPSFWSLIDNEYFDAMGAVPVMLAMILTLLLIYLFLRYYGALDAQALMELALIFSLAIPWLLPRMHERYFYLAELLSICYAAIWPRRAPVALTMLFGGFLIYSAYLFGEVPILSMRLVAACYGGTLCFLLSRCQRHLKSLAARQMKGETEHENDGISMV